MASCRSKSRVWALARPSSISWRSFLRSPDASKAQLLFSTKPRVTFWSFGVGQQEVGLGGIRSEMQCLIEIVASVRIASSHEADLAALQQRGYVSRIFVQRRFQHA